MKLSNQACTTAQPKKKPYKKSDGYGMYLEIMPNGSKYWRMKYRYGGKEKRLAIGKYPDTSLKEAREERRLAKKLLEQGIDPSAEKQVRKMRRIEESSNTFESLARDWHNTWKQNKCPRHALTTMNRFERDVFPIIGHIPVNELTPQVILKLIRKIEERGAYDVAKRVKTACGQIMRFGVGEGRAERDITADLKDVMRPYKPEHYPALDVKELPDFLEKLDSRDVDLQMQTRMAMRLIMLTFVRTSELIRAEWEEIDFKDAVWVIPADKMKMRRDHIVPLSKQALDILNYQYQVNGHRKWVFASYCHTKKHMSSGTLSGAIKRMGYRGKMTGHGFRALAMTTIKEKLGYTHEIVDRQLAHAQSKIAAPYDRAKFLPERTIMMQEYADYIDEVCSKYKEDD